MSNRAIRYFIGIIIVILLQFFGAINSSNSQGFDWEFDSRMPYKIADYYMGINVGYSSINEYGDFNLREDLIECCNFNDGRGDAFFVGITGEYWYDGHTAINVAINYANNKSIFDLKTTLPTRYGDFITKYEFLSTINMLDFDLSVKRRVLNSHFNVGFGLMSTLLLAINEEYSEQAISNNVPFEKRTISNGKTDALNNIIFSPYLRLNYDLNLGINYYASPNISLSYNINDMIKNDTWHRMSISLGVKIFRAVN